MANANDSFLDKVPSDRRVFVRRILGMTGFASPIVRSFVIATAMAVETESVWAIGNTTTRTTHTTPIPIPPDPPAATPEIDPGTLGAAVTLLAAATLVIRERSKD
jgi:hypothetical protein